MSETTQAPTKSDGAVANAGRDLPFWNPALSLEARVEDLIARLTVAEKARQPRAS